MTNRKRVGVVGVSGYGGGEILRLCARHPAVEVVYAAGESSAGQRLGSRYPGLDGRLQDLTIVGFEPHNVPDLDLLFLSLPTGQSRLAVAQLPADLKVIDVGGDHRFVDGWVYGLTEVTGPAAIASADRVADPGCFPAAALLALAPLVARGLIQPTNIIIDAKTGVSGAGRGGGSTFGFAEVNEDVAAYNLFQHAHTPEMREAISRMAGGAAASVVFSPHLIPMTRGILATVYLRPSGGTTVETLRELYREFCEGSPFLRYDARPPSTKSVSGSNLAALNVSEQDGVFVVTCAVDNLLKGAAGQGVQAFNIRYALDETAGLPLQPQWP